LLQDPKPLVVGIGWVVECVEQRVRVDEARFNINLDGMNVAGTNKVYSIPLQMYTQLTNVPPQRRRSMLPKHITGEEGSEANETQQEGESSRVDVSMEASEADSSMRSIDEEDLPPLEKARRRMMLLAARTWFPSLVHPLGYCFISRLGCICGFYELDNDYDDYILHSLLSVRLTVDLFPVVSITFEHTILCSVTYLLYPYCSGT
jgi:hypothetical protein